MAKGPEENGSGVLIPARFFGREVGGSFVGTFQKLEKAAPERPVSERSSPAEGGKGGRAVAYSIGDAVGEADKLDASAAFCGRPLGKERVNQVGRRRLGVCGVVGQRNGEQILRLGRRHHGVGGFVGHGRTSDLGATIARQRASTAAEAPETRVQQEEGGRGSGEGEEEEKNDPGPGNTVAFQRSRDTRTRILTLSSRQGRPASPSLACEAAPSGRLSPLPLSPLGLLTPDFSTAQQIPPSQLPQPARAPCAAGHAGTDWGKPVR